MEKKMSAAKAEKVLQGAVDITDRMVAAAEAAEKPDYYRTGRCRFCGEENHTNLETFETQAEADDYVSDHCTCSQATRARARREEQNYYEDMIDNLHFERQQNAAERAEIAQSAMDTINQLFGNGAKERGAVAIDDEVLGFLHTAAMLVYDGLIGAFSTSVAPSVSVKITCKKQVIAIERGEATKQKLEVI